MKLIVEFASLLFKAELCCNKWIIEEIRAESIILPEYLCDPELSIDSLGVSWKHSCLHSTEDDTLVGIISIRQYRDISRQPHMATISYDRLGLRYAEHHHQTYSNG